MKYLSIFIISLLLFSCKNDSEKQPETPQKATSENELILNNDQLKTLDINTISLEEKPTFGTLQLNGKVDLDPNSRVTLSSALGGHIKSVRALPGKHVKKGDVIFTIEDQQFVQLQQDYLTTQAQLLSASPNYNRQKELNKNKSTSDKILQQAETDYKSLLAIQSGLKEKLRLININPSTINSGNIRRSIAIVAPFNGVVSKVMANNGKYVAPSDELAELFNPQGLLFNLRIFERDLPKIQIGQNIQVFTNGNPDHKIEAKIISKGSSIAEDGSTEIIAKAVGETLPEIATGIYINAIVAVENFNAFTVPTESVVSFNGKNYVFEQASKDKFRLQEVEIGEEYNGFTPINNFKALLNKKIVNKGAYRLLMALKNKAEE